MIASNPSNEQITITLPDGTQKTFDSGVTGSDIAYSIGEGLGKAALAVKVNGEMIDISRPIHASAPVEIITRRSDEALELIRHDCAHVLAEAVQEIFPGTKVTIGPVIDDGFYYDFDRPEPFSTDDFEKIEAKMKEIIKRGDDFVREEWDRDDAIEYFKKTGENFKVELIQDLPEGEVISIYRQGKWLDLCRGPHMSNTKHVGDGFKLMKLAGAYWRGDSDREQLQRIYGTAWRDKKELQTYLTRLEEAEKRDHRKLGTELELFHTQEDAAGSIFWHPKGLTMYHTLENYIRMNLDRAGYDEVKTPQLMNSKFWEASGHWSKFRENMFVVPDVVPSTDEDGDVIQGEVKDYMAIKPMNCPAHVQIFKKKTRSYRDLPLRLAEFGCCHRNEPSGALHGLMRVRQMTQDDAHIFCTPEQVTSESISFCKLVFRLYKELGFDEVNIKFATRPEKRAGSDDVWEKAEEALIDALEELNEEYEIAPGEGAFYGPKLEFHLTDAIGRSWQCGTLQLDFVLPERLDANYIDENGDKQRPVMLHRAALGSMERFLGILIENYAGAMPVWLAPVQCVVAPITNDFDDYAKRVAIALEDAGVRVETDLRNEKVSYKVREHSVQKVPYIVAVGEREAEAQTVSVRKFGSEGQTVQQLKDFIQKLSHEVQIPGLSQFSEDVVSKN